MQWLMLQQVQPEDFVIATGEHYSVREFVELAASEMGIHIRWRGEGVDRKGYNSRGQCIVQVDRKYFRPTEVDSLLGDASKARQQLGWRPRTSFRELVAEMVNADMAAAERDKLVKENGYAVYEVHE